MLEEVGELLIVLLLYNDQTIENQLFLQMSKRTGKRDMIKRFIT